MLFLVSKYVSNLNADIYFGQGNKKICDPTAADSTSSTCVLLIWEMMYCTLVCSVTVHAYVCAGLFA